jgi:hypothetical protein
MFTPHYFIDNVQQLKRHTVANLVSDPALKDEMLTLIDAQTQFYKSAVNSSLAILVATVKNIEPK